MAAMGGAEGLGNKSIKRLVKFFGSAKVAWSAEAGDMRQAGVKRNAIEAFVAFRREHPNAPDNLVSYCQRQKIGLCSINDDDYPPILKEIKDSPMFFYYRGQLQPHVQRIAIVGSRHNTAYGQSVALELAEDLAAAGLTVVSGGARGIDTIAHRGALKSGRTVAVLGCGINIIYPRENRKLFEQIAERGVVMSEFPPQFPPSTGTFPTRNRIIAGLCRGVVVVEAGEKSGALLTSKFAFDEDRDVFAIPGTVYAEMSVGCHNLIRKNEAKLIKNARDILNEYEITADDKSPAKSVELDEAEAAVLNIIPPDEFITEDEIFDRLDDINPSELSNVMLMLEMKGCVEGVAGRYRRKGSPVSKPVAQSVKLDGAEAAVLNIIPPKGFITEDEILMRLDDISPSELPGILLALEMKSCVEQDAGRYKRKFGG